MWWVLLKAVLMFFQIPFCKRHFGILALGIYPTVAGQFDVLSPLNELKDCFLNCAYCAYSHGPGCSILYLVWEVGVPIIRLLQVYIRYLRRNRKETMFYSSRSKKPHCTPPAISPSNAASIPRSRQKSLRKSRLKRISHQVLDHLGH